MTNFFQTIHCLSRAHCVTCRNRNKGHGWREQILRVFKTEVSTDFDCPYGVAWEIKEAEKVETDVVTTSRPEGTFKQAQSFGQAIVTGKYVANEILKERVAICGKCEFLRIDPNGHEWCAVCGCKTSSEDRKINNLAAYEENLPKWGCKYPKRHYGIGGWKR